MTEQKEADKGLPIMYGQSGERLHKLLLSLSQKSLIPLVGSEGMWPGSQVGSTGGLILIKEKLLIGLSENRVPT